MKRTGKITLPSSFPSSNWPAGHSFLSTFFDVQRRLAPRRSWSTTSVPTLCLHPSISIPRAAPSGVSPQILSPAASLSTPPRFAFFLTYFALFHSTECSPSPPFLPALGTHAHVSVHPDLRAVFPFEAAAVAEYPSVTRRETVWHYHHLV